MNAKWKSAVFIVFTVVAGIGVVILETPPNLLLFVVWSVFVCRHVRRICKHGGNKSAVVTGAVHAAIMATIIAGATAAPVKLVDAVLKQPVNLPADKMTIAELSEYCQFNRTSFPLSIYIPSAEQAAQKHIQFSSKSLSLQQFISEIERQTGWTHRFHGCGNAYSILYGNAYNFGLGFTVRSPSY